MDNKCKIIGDVKISGEKKEEFIYYALELLKVGGIRRVQELVLNGQTVKVVEYPTIDENGVISFNYSIFEKKEREMSYFDTQTCKLECVDKGYMEYELVIELLMVMQVVYSESNCIFLGHSGAVSDMWMHAVCIKQLIGLTLDFTDRANCWKNILLLRKYGYTKERPYSVWSAIPLKFHSRSIDYLLSTFYVEENIVLPVDYPDNDFWQIKKGNTRWIDACVLNILKCCVKTEGVDNVCERLKRLLTASLEVRKGLCEVEDKYWARLAELSLYVLPPVFIRALATITMREFWEIWDSFEIEGYMEIICLDEQKMSKEIETTTPIFWSIIKKDENLAKLEFFSNDETVRFPDIAIRLKTWQRKYREISDAEAKNVDIEIELAEIMTLQRAIWDTHYMAKSLVCEFLENMKDVRYKKAVYLYKQIMEEDIAVFPEMTRRQVLNHVIKYTNTEEKCSELQAYASVLCNIELRKEVLGF